MNDVIYSLESYDTTTVRASTPMWLLCKYIKEHTNCRYIFSGEGSDEILGGYLYFHNAPSTDEFALENMRRCVSYINSMVCGPIGVRVPTD